jgi:S-DNA-T family DNA segregation ATPase FtsK/SpoIIIE
MMLKIAELMEARYSKFAELGIRSIEECYCEFDQTVVIIDEVVDLFLQDQSGELKKLITRISQKARAAGIYLVLATQRPSKDVFPTTLKANFGRVACRTASRVDSEVVLDGSGAEKLLGRGDAFIKNMEHDMVRFQVAYSDLKRNLKMYEYLMKLN